MKDKINQETPNKDNCSRLASNDLFDGALLKFKPASVSELIPFWQEELAIKREQLQKLENEISTLEEMLIHFQR